MIFASSRPTFACPLVQVILLFCPSCFVGPFVLPSVRLSAPLSLSDNKRIERGSKKGRSNQRIERGSRKGEANKLQHKLKENSITKECARPVSA
jgi:hypothetical protein